MKKTIVCGIIRALLASAGGAVTTSGFMDEDTANQVIGAIMVIVAAIWSAIEKWRGKAIPSTAALVILGATAMALLSGCATSANDIKMAEVASKTALAYYGQENTAQIIHAVGPNVTWTITGVSELTFSAPVPPRSIYPRDQGTLETVIGGVERMVPWGVAGIVGSKMAEQPKVVTVHDQVPMATQVIEVPVK